ncbi:head GIN domain-containing protein [Larkinella soli]|uniref:head GIN domain-containing protein n=1 Tax=Larkinella soli TaxID=1770527 RepID=UPI000FFC1B23|nr:head GIN domain-containing protein [Larkinella soli]
MEPAIRFLLAADVLPAEPIKNYLQLTLLSFGLIALITTVWWQADRESYEEVTEDFSVTAFEKLNFWGALNVLITAGPAYTLTARGTRRAIRSLKVRQRGRWLEVGSRFLFWHRQRDLVLTVTAPSLNELDVSGACIVQMNGFRELNHLNIDITGASNVTVEGEAQAMSVDITGASKLTLIGRGTRLTADITGASTLYAFDYPVEDATIEVTGACTAQIHATRVLKADATGASQVKYQGDPSVQFDSTGASSIKKV